MPSETPARKLRKATPSGLERVRWEAALSLPYQYPHLESELEALYGVDLLYLLTAAQDLPPAEGLKLLHQQNPNLDLKLLTHPEDLTESQCEEFALDLVASLIGHE